MKPQFLFKALAEIAEEHERGGENLLVIPVLTDELESRRGLLAEVASFLGGSMLDASVAEDRNGDGILAYDDPLIRAAVEEGFDFDRPGVGPTKVSLDFDGDRIKAKLTVRDRVVTVPSPAEQQLMSLAESLFDVSLKEDELAVLLYDEKTFDEPSQTAALQTLMGLSRQAGLRLGAVRTLVPLIHSAGLDRQRHCSYRRGVRYSLGDSSMIRRNPDRDLHDSVRLLAAERDQPLVLFLGAGFSASSGMPVGNSVRNETILRICQLPEQVDGRSDDDLARALFDFAEPRGLLSEREQMIGREEFVKAASLEQAVRIERDFMEEPIPRTIRELKNHHDGLLAADNLVLGQAVYALHRMLAAEKPLVLVTVNFDEFVEHEHSDRLDIGVTDEDFERLGGILAGMATGAAHPEAKIPYLKMHGTFERPDSCVATDEATRAGISVAKASALRQFVSALPENERLQWVYVGASMRDIDLNNLFGEIQFNESVSERWVAPWLEPSVKQFVYSKRRWWAAEGIPLLRRAITETADTFVEKLARQWVGD